MTEPSRPVALVLASTYPRWRGDPEPGFVHELCRRLTACFDVIALVPDAPGADASGVLDGVEVIRYRYAPSRLETLVNDGGIVTNLRRSKWKLLLVPGFILAQAWRAWRLTRTRKIDAVHAHWLLPQGLIAALLPGIPFVVTSHGADLYALRGRLLNTLKRFVIRKSSATTVVSGAMRKTLLDMGADVGKVSVLSMGVDISQHFIPNPHVPRSTDEILFVGRLVEKKGVHFLLRAMPEILRRYPSAYLTIVGFGPEERSLQALASALDLGDKARFLGAVQQSELPTLYQRAALFVAPFVEAVSGDQEGLGLVVMEALGCECPVVVGDVPAMAEIFGTHLCEVVVDPKDTAVLASRVVRALSDPSATRDLTAKIRTAVGERFSWDTVAAGYTELLWRARETAMR